MWYVITGEPNYITGALGESAKIVESILRPGRTGEHVLVASVPTDHSLSPTLKVNGSYESESEARVAAKHFADMN